MEEQGTHKPLVVGSNPALATKKDLLWQEVLFLFHQVWLFHSNQLSAHDLKVGCKLRQLDLGQNQIDGAVQRQVLAQVYLGIKI